MSLRTLYAVFTCSHSSSAHLWVAVAAVPLSREGLTIVGEVVPVEKNFTCSLKPVVRSIFKLTTHCTTYALTLGSIYTRSSAFSWHWHGQSEMSLVTQ